MLGTGWVFVICVNVGLLAAWNTGNNLLYVIVGGLGSFVLMSLVLASWNMRNLTVVRTSPDAVHRGEKFGVTLRIENRKLIMPAVSLRAVSTARPGESAAYIPKVPPRRAALVRATESFDKRGVYPLPPMDVATTFPFGLFTRRKRLRDNIEVVVYPRVMAVRTAVLNKLAGARQVPKFVRGDGSDFFSLRDYIPGDDIRHVSWRASARLGRLLVKELVHETSRSVVFVLDTHWRPDVDHFPERFEEAIELVASLAVTMLNQQYTVAVVTPGRALPPGEGAAYVHKVLDMLARLTPARKSHDGGFDWFSDPEGTGLASHVFVSPNPWEWGSRTAFAGARVLDPKEIIRA